MKLFLKALGVVFALAMMTACSNSDDSKSSTTTGTAVFFHNIEDAPELQLDAVDESTRNGYGTVSFEQFGAGVVLKPKTWSLEVVDEQGTIETVDDQVILEGAEFSIKSKTLKIIALTGTYDTNDPDNADLQVHALDVAEDDERDEDDQELVQFINISHLDKDLGPLNIYIVTEAHSTDSLSLLVPDAVIDFGQSSDTVRLERLAIEYADYYVRIAAVSAPTVEIFNSGKRRLKDYLKQTIIISPNLTGVGTSPLVAFYYGGGISDKWFDKADNIGALRVFNGLRDSVDLDVIADNANDLYDQIIDSDMVFNEVSPFVSNMVAEAGTYVVTATEGATEASQIAVDIGSAEFWTVVFYGRTDDAVGIPVKESRNASGSHASVTFTNASYFVDPDNLPPYNVNVHIKKTDESLGSSSVSIAELAPDSYGNILKPVGSYEIFVTKTNNTNVVDHLSIDLLANTNYNFVIVESAGSGYDIIQLP